jgi:hypothetical protein
MATSADWTSTASPPSAPATAIAGPSPTPYMADAVHRLWWERLSNDLWQLRLHYDNTDMSCDHRFTSASAVPGWWTTHRDAVTAAFTGS